MRSSVLWFRLHGNTVEVIRGGGVWRPSFPSLSLSLSLFHSNFKHEKFVLLKKKKTQQQQKSTTVTTRATSRRWNRRRLQLKLSGCLVDLCRCRSLSCIQCTPLTLPAYRRPAGSCSRWSGAPLRWAWGATLRSPRRRRTWSSGAATRRAARAPPSRTGQGRGSSKRNQAVSGVSRAGPHSPFPFSFAFCVRTTGFTSDCHSRRGVVGLTCCPHSLCSAPRTAPDFVQ